MSAKFTDYNLRLPVAVIKSFEAMCRLQGEDPNEVLVRGLIKVFKLELDKVDVHDPEDMRMRPMRKPIAKKVPAPTVPASKRGVAKKAGVKPESTKRTAAKATTSKKPIKKITRNR